ncbi:MAG: hypothetical protein Q9184_005640 [Pyrenodesmia sp. 2 TL-2023]
MKPKQSSKVRGGPLPKYHGTKPSLKTSAKALQSETVLIWNTQVRTKQPEPEPSKPEPYGLKPEQLDPQGEAKRARLLDAIAQGRFKPVGRKDCTDEDGMDEDRMDEDRTDVHYIFFSFDDGRSARYERFLNLDIYAMAPLAGNKIRARQDAALASPCRTLPDFANDSERDQYLATPSGLLRHIPKDYVYIAGDKNDQIIVYLDPIGIRSAFGNRVKRRLQKETIEFFAMKQPTPPAKNDTRHQSHAAHLERNGFSENQCGVDHMGILHRTGNENNTSTRTSDWTDLSGVKQQLYEYYLRNTVGIITKLLDFELGFLAPTMRQQHRDVYDGSGEFLRFRPTNPKTLPETYTYRAIVVNMQTDMHRDTTDWDRGLTGICQLGQFKGSAMVLRDLGVVLHGYQSGATLHFRGNILWHYTTEWTGKCRYAFDHTTKQSIRAQVEADNAKKREAALDPVQPAVADTSEDDSDTSEDDSDASEEELDVSEDEPDADALKEEADAGEWITRFLANRALAQKLRETKS